MDKKEMNQAANEVVVFMIKERVASALTEACKEEFGSYWNRDVALKFASAAMRAIGINPDPQPVKLRVVAGSEVAGSRKE